MAENRAKVTGTILEIAPAEAGTMRLHVKIQASEDVEGLPNRTKDLVDQEADLFIPEANMPAVGPGDRFEAQVSLSGDESGGRLTVIEMKKID